MPVETARVLLSVARVKGCVSMDTFSVVIILRGFAYAPFGRGRGRAELCIGVVVLVGLEG